jgi:hypothetical protein
MKRSKLILLGSIGIVAIAALFVASPFAFNKTGTYKKDKLSFANDQSSEDALKWLDARYFDPATGQKMSHEKLVQMEKAVMAAPRNKAINLTWREEGPDNIGGRTRAVLIDRTDINRIYAGSVSGGLFVSTDRANNWTKVLEYPGSKFISSMCQTQDGIIFIATGSLNEGWTGNGVHYSSDKGVTWNVIPGSSTIPNITEIVCGDNSNTVFMATTNGVKSWTLNGTLVSHTTTIGQSSAIQISPDGQVIVAAAGASRTFVSTDAGSTFTDQSGSGAGQVPVGAPRIEYAISKIKNSSGRYSIYAVRTNNNLQGMSVSHDNGASFSQFVGASGTPSNLDIYRNQGTYNSIVTVNPTDPEAILIGGIDIWKWKQQVNNPPSGGFEKLSLWFLNPMSPNYVHADNHEMKWDAQNRLYVGNDGGIGVSTNFGASWNPANRGYNVTQFYGIAFDRDGSVLGGTQDNGTLYNNHSLASYKEFTEVTGGDGFECEISFFNPKVMFTSIYYNAISRSADGGKSFGAYNPGYPGGHGTIGVSGPSFPFHTEFFLGENYDLNSKDSITFLPTRNYLANTTIKISSTSSGDTIKYITPTALYFSDTLNHKASLTENRTSVVNARNGQNVLLDNYSYSYISGSAPPTAGDSLLVNFSTGQDTVVVQSVGTYKWYKAQHPTSNKIIEIGLDSIAYNIPWDTVRVQDPFQSWLIVYTAANGGEIWGTRNSLRFAATDPIWVVLAKGIGGNLFSSIDIEFSRDLNTLYVSTGGRINRLIGLGNIYTSDPLFANKTGYHGSGGNTAPTATTLTTIYTASVEGIAVNPNNANDLLLLPGGGGAPRRSVNANGGAPTFTALSTLAGNPFTYDAIIDRNDPNVLVVGTNLGVFTSDDGGVTWSYNSEGFEGTPVYEVRQNWRSFSEGNNRPGEIYIGTFGRGIWASSSVLGLSDNGKIDVKTFKTRLKTFPNPTVNSTSITFELASNSDVKVMVYSITGNLVKTVSVKNMNRGENTLDIEANDLPKGTYIVKFTAGSQHETSKFIKL